MTRNRRIFLNVVATYSRSLYGLFLGIICARWTLTALGETDYGLMGLLAGLVAFITFFNGIMASSISRYFAVMVGEALRDGESGLERCRMWFTTGVVIHTVIPLVLVVIGYPIGSWAVEHFLTIPADRIWHCHWVWRFVCCSAFLSMMMVPFNAMYTAKQYIAELTIYSFVSATLNALFQYYMVTHPGVWLVKLSLWSCCLGMLPNFIIAIRAFFLFPECRIIPRYFSCWRNIGQLGNYAFWNAWGTLGTMLRGQGVAVVINKYFGPRLNAGMQVGNTLAANAESLYGSLAGALSPAIFNAWGAGQVEEARRLAYRVCKIGTLLILIFAIPMAIEADTLLAVWLKNPPPYASGYCLFMLLWIVLDKTTWGITMLINAKGKIALFQAVVGTCVVSAFPLAWIFAALGVGPYSPGWAAALAVCVTNVGRVWFGRKLVGISVRYWGCHIFIPLIVITVLLLGVGLISRLMLPFGLVRIMVTTMIVEVVLLPASWFWILDVEERAYVQLRVLKLLGRLKVHK